MSRRPDESSGRPSSVWLTGQQHVQTQLRDRGYVPGSAKDIQRISPAVAEHAIALYSEPGDLVVDPDCGAGTVPTEAVRAGRHSVGFTPDPWSWRLARANLSTAKRAGAWPDGRIIETGPASRLVACEAGLRRRADLVLTAVRVPTTSDSPSPDSDLTASVRTWADLLRPGGHAVILLGPRRAPDGTLVDLPSAVLDAVTAVRLIPIDRCVALLAPIRGGRITGRKSGIGRRTAAGPVDGHRTASVAHHTVLVLRAPELESPARPVFASAWSAVRTRTDLRARSLVLAEEPHRRLSAAA
jgi:modification methylase